MTIRAGGAARPAAAGLLAVALVLALIPGTPVFAHSGGSATDEEQVVTGVKGPYTIEGIVYDPQGKPAANCPVRILPVMPGKGVDTDNLIYRIPGRDDHRTVTDANGRFILTHIIDYPEVKNHIYRVVVNADHDLPYTQPVGNGVISFAAMTTNRLFFEFHTEPAAMVKLILKDRSGKPFTGTRAISVTSRKGTRFLKTVEFKDGVARIYTAAGDARNPGQIALFRWATNKEAKQQELAQGHELGLYNRPLYGLQAQQNVLLLPGQEATVEFVLSE